jgi:hypothetical protein
MVPIFSNQIFQFVQILEGLGKESVCIFYGQLEYITAIWSILGPFVNLMVIGYIFPRFGTLHQEKSGNPVHHHHVNPFTRRS